MKRAELVEKAARAIADTYGHPSGMYKQDAARVVDAILPQVTTVEELEALPFDTKVIDNNGEAWARYYLATKDPRPLRWRNSRGGYGKTSLLLANNAPLTVVWSPS